MCFIVKQGKAGAEMLGIVLHVVVLYCIAMQIVMQVLYIDVLRCQVRYGMAGIVLLCSSKYCSSWFCDVIKILKRKRRNEYYEQKRREGNY
jgi:hypothetical protein